MHPLATRPRTPLSTRILRCCAFAGVLFAGAAHAFDWQVDVTPAGELFPALQLSQTPRTTPAGIGGGDGLISVHVRGASLPPRLRLSVETPGLRAPAVVEANAVAGMREIELHPRLDWDIGELRRLPEARRQTLRLTLEADGVVQTRRVDVRLHPLDDAPYYVREGRDRVDLGWSFAGYVDPHDPVVDEVLASARMLEPDFDATSDVAQHDATLRRVGAVWAALEQRGLRYASGDPALSRGPIVWSQRVRLPADVWRDRRANCIDSSVLIAAVLERLGMRASIVLVPGHAFVGYRGNGDSAAMEYLETTLLGAHRDRADPLARAADNFAAARAAGRLRWRRAVAKLDGHHGPDYALIDIGTARAYGIIPLGAGERASRHPPEATPAPAGSSRERGLP
jgi:hypothetical protein